MKLNGAKIGSNGVGDFTKVSSGSFMLPTNTSVYGYTIEHGLGIIPKYAYIYTDGKAPEYIYTILSETFDANIVNYNKIFYVGNYGRAYGAPDEYVGYAYGSLNEVLTADKIILRKPTAAAGVSSIGSYDWELAAGLTYHWIALA